MDRGYSYFSDHQALIALRFLYDGCGINSAQDKIHRNRRNHGSQSRSSRSHRGHLRHRRRRRQYAARDPGQNRRRDRRRDGGRGLLALPLRRPARAPGAARHGRPGGGIGRQGLDAGQRRPGRIGGRARPAGNRGRRDQPSALQIFPRDRRRALSRLFGRAGAGRAAKTDRRDGGADARAAANSAPAKCACSRPRPTRSRKSFRTFACARLLRPRKRNATSIAGG